MNFKIKLFFCFIILNSQAFTIDQKLIPILFYQNSSKGGDWVYENRQLHIFGAGIQASYNNENWNISARFIQFGFLGNVNDGLFKFSPHQNFPYIDGSKDADGFWSEHLDTKISYTKNSLIIEFGKFDRHWGFGKRSIYLSKKVPSYPQFGINWEINDRLKLIYFHGFLNSGIIDSSRSNFYKNSFSRRTLDIPKNIASHRIEWIFNPNIKIGLNESVIYAFRNIDVHYLIPFAPFYPIENYLGDIDNIQMGLDASFKIKKNFEIYFGFFMDELTPEWIFKKKNHNWFAWQFGFSKKDFLLKGTSFIFEYIWTDQRIYKHKYPFNDFYSYETPLGFWAGPHAEEFLIDYNLAFKNNIVRIGSSIVKRGNIGNDLVQGNYQDTYNPRYFDGYEHKIKNYIYIERKSKLKGLSYLFGANALQFINLELNNISLDKHSIDVGFYFNFPADRLNP